MFKTASLLKSLWTPIKTSVRCHPFPPNYIQFLRNLPETTVSQLNNGVTIACEQRPIPNVCVGLFVDSGSRYECDFESGITHFFEHIAFKCTRARNRFQIEEQMNCTGAKFKCFTTRDMCVYYAECLYQDVTLVVDLLSDCVFNNSYNHAEIEAQKGIVYEEMIEQDQNANALLFEYLHSTAFQGTPLARSILGPSTNLYNWNEATLCRHLCQYFNPSRTLLAAVGGIKHSQLECLANTYLSHYDPVKCRDSDIYRYTGSEVRYRNDDMPKANVAFALEGPSFCDEDKTYLDVAGAVLGGWDLSQYGGRDHGVNLAKRASLGKFCDAYKNFSIEYKDTSLWGIQFLSGSLQCEDMLYSIQDVLMQMCSMMTEGELQRAKHQVKTTLLHQTESCVGAFMDLGRHVLYNCHERPTILERLCAVDRVTVVEFKDVCMKYIYDKCPVVVAIGPTEGLPDYTRIRAGMYWLRF